MTISLCSEENEYEYVTQTGVVCLISTNNVYSVITGN